MTLASGYHLALFPMETSGVFDTSAMALISDIVAASTTGRTIHTHVILFRKLLPSPGAAALVPLDEKLFD